MDGIIKWMMGRCERSIDGVLHIGANSGQEAGYYSKLGLKVIWIEADPDLFQTLESNIAAYCRQTAYLCLASDVDGQEVDFHIASNDGGSSSVLKIDAPLFSKEWPTISEVRSVRLQTCRLDNFLEQHRCNLNDVNLIVADVQGYELPVLRGLGSLINGFEAIISELNWAPMYRDVTKPHELESFLVRHGFRRLWLGVSWPQATGVWVRGKTSKLRHLYMFLSARLCFMAARCGLLKLLLRSGILELGRRTYYTIKGRSV